MKYGINPLALLVPAIIMSSPPSPEKKSRLGARLIRAFFLGLGAGFIAFLAVYFIGIGLNMQAGTTIFNAIAIGLAVLGIFLLITLGIEWSEYMAE